MVKQYLKNRHGNHYGNGWLDAPSKYDYLKRNSAKRNPTGSRKKKGLLAAAGAQKSVKKRCKARERLANVNKPGMVVDEDEQEENEEDEHNDSRSDDVIDGE